MCVFFASTEQKKYMSQVEKKKVKIELRKNNHQTMNYMCQGVYRCSIKIDLQLTPHCFSPDLFFNNDKPERVYFTTETEL